jgi:flagellar motor switch protein FliM
MAAGLVDRSLGNLAAALAEGPLAGWASGFAYASFLDDPRPLGLLLDDVAYRVLDCQVTFGTAGRSGRVLLVLPADRRSEPVCTPPPAAGAEAAAWSATLRASVMRAEVPLHAVLVRLRLPLASLVGLGEGAIVPLGPATVDRVTLEAGDGTRVAEGRLGQTLGMRAVRLTAVPAESGVAAATVDPRPPRAEPPAPVEAPVGPVARAG